MKKRNKVQKISARKMRKAFADSSLLAEKWGAKYKRG